MDITKIKSLRNQSAVLDNNILSDFIEIDALPLINLLFSQVYIPASIYEDEVLVEDRDKVSEIEFQATAIEEEGSFHLFMEISEKRPKLTDYDVEVIVIAYEKAVLCSSNERAIHQTCEEYKILCTGSIGIIVSCFEHELITKESFCSLIIKLFDSKARISDLLKRQIFSQYPFLEEADHASDLI